MTNGSNVETRWCLTLLGAAVAALAAGCGGGGGAGESAEPTSAATSNAGATAGSSQPAAATGTSSATGTAGATTGTTTAGSTAGTPAAAGTVTTPGTAQGAVITDEGLSILGANRWTENPQVFYDDVRGGFEAVGAALGAEVGIDAKSPWGSRSKAGLRFRYEQGTTRSGDTGLIYRANGYHTVLGSPRYSGTGKVYDRMYVSWWYKPSIHPNSQGASNKFIRLWDEGNGYGTRISWTQMHMTCDVPAGYKPEVSWRSWGGNVAQWNRHEIEASLDQPIVRTWVNGVAGHVHPCVKDPKQSARPMYLYVLGFDHGGNADGTNSYLDMVTEMADIYIANSPARVELSDSPTWSAAQRRELQPVRAWAPGRIDLKYVRGTLPKGAQLYAYVVNADGSVAEAGQPVSCRTKAGVC